jgi:uncharacterized protein YqhQ
MRGRDAIAVAVRDPDGRIVWATERLDTGFHASRWSKAPLVRGLVILYETLVVGTRWLVRSASLAASEEGVEIGKGSIAIMLSLTLVAAIGLFFLLPLLVATVTTAAVPAGIVQQVVEGLVRIAIFLGYLAVIAQAPDVRRVFQYHGAEHMTIHALEAGDPLSTAAVRKYPTAHPRCGTEFLVLVVLISILVFGLVGRQSPAIMVGSRIVLIPVIAAVSYEVLRWAAKHRGNRLVRALTYPGILVQKITTRRPTDDMIEVAIVSMEEALSADGEAIPGGSTALAREPMATADDRRAARVRRAGGPAIVTPTDGRAPQAPAAPEVAAPISIDPPFPGG